MLKVSSMEASVVSVAVGVVLTEEVSGAPVGIGSVAEQPTKPMASTVMDAA